MSLNEFASATSPASRLAFAPGLGRRLDALLVKMLNAALRNTPAARLHVTLPSGCEATVGRSDRDIAARVMVNRYRGLAKTLNRGLLGFADGYIASDIDCDNLKALFTCYIDAEPALYPAVRRLFQSARRDRMFHCRRANTRLGSQRNIAAHYDLGNAFYRLWLDSSMAYSSGIYTDAAMTLEAAQQNKSDRILNALDLNSAHDLLEIGCGWGGFAEAAARRAGSVTGITISRRQHEEASSRIQRAGLSGRVNIVLQDYRDTSRQFHRIASIEMIEAVGEENWPVYFRVLADRLSEGGKAVIQAITIRQDLFDEYRCNPDFIQRYIFPGGMLPTVGAMRQHAEAAGFAFETVETFASSYVLTLDAWRKQFHEAWPRIAALGFDDRFRRMWDYYLCYCAAGFERGTIDVGLYRLVKRS